MEEKLTPWVEGRRIIKGEERITHGHKQGSCLNTNAIVLTKHLPENF